MSSASATLRICLLYTYDEVRDWLAAMRAEGIALTIASNNDAARVRPFADRVGLQFVSMACKPLPIGLMAVSYTHLFLVTISGWM